MYRTDAMIEGKYKEKNTFAETIDKLWQKTDEEKLLLRKELFPNIVWETDKEKSMRNIRTLVKGLEEEYEAKITRDKEKINREVGKWQEKLLSIGV